MATKEKIMLAMQGEIAPILSFSNPSLRWKTAKIIMTQINLWIIVEGTKERVPITSVLSTSQEVPGAVRKKSRNAIMINYLDSGKEKAIALDANPSQIKKLKRFVSLTQLNNRKVSILHPAKIGGVIQEGSQWVDGLMRATRSLSDGEIIQIRRPDEDDLVIKLKDVQQAKMLEQSSGDASKKAVDLKYSSEGIVYNTAISFDRPTQLVEYVNDFLQRSGVVSGKRVGDELVWAGEHSGLTLGEREQEILVALYSGIPSLEMASMMDGDVETVEKIYDDLIQKGLLEIVRIRKEVQLTPKGRHQVDKLMEGQAQGDSSTF